MKLLTLFFKNSPIQNIMEELGCKLNYKLFYITWFVLKKKKKKLICDNINASTLRNIKESNYLVFRLQVIKHHVVVMSYFVLINDKQRTSGPF